MNKIQNLLIEAETTIKFFSNIGKSLAEKCHDSLSYIPNILCFDKTFFLSSKYKRNRKNNQELEKLLWS